MFNVWPSAEPVPAAQNHTISLST